MHSEAELPAALKTPSLVLLGILLVFGTYWAFIRGGNDFGVFFHAGELVLAGRAAEIYSDSPDRYLYAPGFAWIFAPFALLPKDLALAIWCFGKAAAIGVAVRELGRIFTISLASLAFVLLAKPLLIDFEYGQINTFILSAAIVALLGKQFAVERPFAWLALSALAVGKLIALPLLLVVFLPGAGTRKEKFATLLGATVVLGLPFFQGVSEALSLYHGWQQALILKGLPMESHNQSFLAVMYHYMSGLPTYVRAIGSEPLQLGAAILSEESIRWMGIGWSLLAGGFLLGWILLGNRKSFAWRAVAIGAMILPSHLIWKPYFLFGIPAALVCLDSALRSLREKGSIAAVVALAIVFVAVNFTGFDFVGMQASARIEAAAIMLWTHLFLIAWAARVARST